MFPQILATATVEEATSSTSINIGEQIIIWSPPVVINGQISCSAVGSYIAIDKIGHGNIVKKSGIDVETIQDIVPSPQSYSVMPHQAIIDFTSS